MHQVTSSLAVSVFGLLSVFLVGAMLLSIGVTLAQVGFVLSGKPLKPQPKRIDPIQGFKRLFSVRTAWQAATGVAKMSVVGLVSIPLLYGVARDLSGDMQFELRSAIAYVAGSTLAIVRITAVVGLVIALADYAFQRWRTDKDMMMSKHDVKQETKNTEGDPQVKARQRAIRMSASRNRMIATVGDADVVVTNPTHVAVALRYRPETGAPGWWHGEPTPSPRGSDTRPGWRRCRSSSPGRSPVRSMHPVGSTRRSPALCSRVSPPSSPSSTVCVCIPRSAASTCSRCR